MSNDFKNSKFLKSLGIISTKLRKLETLELGWSATEDDGFLDLLSKDNCFSALENLILADSYDYEIPRFYENPANLKKLQRIRLGGSLEKSELLRNLENVRVLRLSSISVPYDTHPRDMKPFHFPKLEELYVGQFEEIKITAGNRVKIIHARDFKGRYIKDIICKSSPSLLELHLEMQNHKDYSGEMNWLFDPLFHSTPKLKRLYLSFMKDYRCDNKEASFGESIEEVEVLGCGYFPEDPLFLKPYKHLKKLKMENCNGVYFKPWGFRDSLVELVMFNSEILDFPFQIGFPNLEVLKLQTIDNLLLEGKHWKSNTVEKLRVLELSDLPGFGDALFRKHELKNLCRLMIRRCEKITGKSWKCEMINLKEFATGMGEEEFWLKKKGRKRGFPKDVTFTN